MTPPLTTLQLLKDARDLISDPAKWTQGSFAKDEQGNIVDAMDSTAVRWCMMGALCHCPARNETYTRAIDYIRKYTSCGIAWYNDHSSHPQVLKLFDKAIADAEKDEAQ